MLEKSDLYEHLRQKFAFVPLDLPASVCRLTIKFQIVFDPPDLVEKSVPFFIVRRIFFLKKGAKWFIVER